MRDLRRAAGHGATRIDRQHLRRHRRGRARRRARRSAARRATTRAAASSSPAAPRRSRPAAWAALPGVARVIGNADKLRPETWAPDAAPRRSPTSWRRRETAAHLVTDFAGRARAFVQVQQGCDHRCTFCVIPYRPRPVAQRADRRGGGAGARAGRARLPGGGADRRRHHQLRPRPAGRAGARPDGAPAAGAGAGAAAAAPVLARPGGDG